jgi:hypothetical protein
VAVNVAVIVIVAAPVIVAALVNANATVDVIAKAPPALTPSWAVRV